MQVYDTYILMTQNKELCTRLIELDVDRFTAIDKFLIHPSALELYSQVCIIKPFAQYLSSF